MRSYGVFAMELRDAEALTLYAPTFSFASVAMDSAYR